MKVKMSWMKCGWIVRGLFESQSMSDSSQRRRRWSLLGCGVTDPDPARVVRGVGSIELEDVRDAACSERLDSGTENDGS